ncbi:MAG: EFR1 family ferrodoxin [Clostridia bacterium]|nr:EFR1 family ferrodoxin [Clostridia bacterium]
MVIYFSGTGNSGYVAKRTAKILGDDCLDLFERIRSRDYSPIVSDNSRLIVSAPTYAWRIPHIVTDYLKKTPLENCKGIYFLMTCGDDIGNAEKHLKKLCAQIGKEYMGCAHFRMPENYIAMFTAPNDEQASRIIAKSENRITETAETIAKNEKLPRVSVNTVGKLKSGIVNTAFYAFCVKAKDFYATDECVSCGKCEKLCPLSNISMKDGKPEWGKDCTHCMACICKCPAKAVEYGKKSQGKNRYYCKINVE